MGDPSLPLGTVIGRAYTIRSILGAGGMGEVYSAEGPNGREVALKVLHEKAQQDPDIVARFQRESEIAAQIKSPYVARILGAGKERTGRLWIAFERLHGEGLDARLRREQYLSFAEVAPVVDDIFQGLEAAHRAGVVHRDIKPANLFIEKLDPNSPSSPERTRILDFGVSKVVGQRKRAEPSLTAFDATLGSFAYMAPEQVRGSARVDARADLYALGAVCFRCLAGRLPFEGINAVQLIALKLDREPPTLKSVTNDDWPQSVEGFLARMMARDRERRFTSAPEALRAWREVCDTMTGSSRSTMRRTSNIPLPDDDDATVGTED